MKDLCGPIRDRSYPDAPILRERTAVRGVVLAPEIGKELNAL